MGVSPHRVVVVGGGFTGMVAALRLQQKGCLVTLLEASKNLGGLAESFSVGGEPLEKFYHHWFTSDDAIISLSEELGMGDAVEWLPATSAILYKGKLHRFNRPLDLLRFPHLSLLSKLRQGLTLLHAQRSSSWQHLQNETVEDYVRRTCGQQSYDVLWRPLLESKFGEHAPDVSAAWLWWKWKLRGGSRRGMSREALGYPRGGFSSVVTTLAQRLAQAGVTILTNAPVTAVSPKPSGWDIAAGNNRLLHADAVLLTTPPALTTRLAPTLKPATHTQLKRLRYHGAACMVLELKRQLTPYYWTSVNDPHPFVAIIEHTNFVPAERYGTHIVYLARYAPSDADVFTAPENTLIDQWTKRLATIFPHFTKKMVRDVHLARARFAQPIVTLDYIKNLPTLEPLLPNLYWASMAHVYPEDRGTNYAVQLGDEAAKKILTASKSSKPTHTAESQAP